MAGQSITVSRDVRADPPVVWSIVTDLDRAHRILTSVERVERIEGEAYEVGTRWRETRRVFGRDETQELQVVEAAPPHRAVIVSESDGMAYRTEIQCESSWVGTLLQFTFTAEPTTAGLGKKVMFATLGKAGIKGAKTMLEQDLEDIVRYVDKSIRR